MTPKPLFNILQRWLKARFTENKIPHHFTFIELHKK